MTEKSLEWRHVIWKIAWGYKSSLFHRKPIAVLCQRNIPLNKSISGTKQLHSRSELPKETILKQHNLFS